MSDQRPAVSRDDCCRTIDAAGAAVPEAAPGAVPGATGRARTVRSARAARRSRRRSPGRRRPARRELSPPACAAAGYRRRCRRRRRLPPPRSRACTARAAAVGGSGGTPAASRCHTGRCSPPSSAMRVALTGPPGVSSGKRAHTTRPDRHRRVQPRRDRSRAPAAAVPRCSQAVAGKLDAVQHRQHLGQAFRSRHLLRRSDVLPAHQEAHVVGPGDRLDLPPQPVQRVAVDARQQAPLAPFDLAVRIRRPGREGALHGEALGLQGGQRLRHRSLRLPDGGGELRFRHRAQRFQPAAQQLRAALRRLRTRAGNGRGMESSGVRPLPPGPATCHSGRRSAATHSGPGRESSAAWPVARATSSSNGSDPVAGPVAAPALLLGQDIPAGPARRAGRRRPRPEATPRCARGRSPRGPARRARAPPAGPASGGCAPPACGAPPAARRPGRRTGRALSISCANGDGSERSRQTSVISPDRTAPISACRASMSIASVRQSSMVWATSGWSGTSRSPVRFSAQASWSGNTSATRSSACMRCR